MIDIVYTSSSWRDQKRIIDYFDAEHAESAALRFLQALDETIRFIRDFPDLGNPWDSVNPRHVEVRYRLVKGFESYLVIYRRYQNHVLIVRILHASQDIESELG